ncbi:glycoside hydrolase family 15 protein [Nitrospira moscoviensis]|uniref:Glycoside hydrolase n=1 Tax=Nitrospira moscoviensis TaxID=42253 RepID=A0A0K2GDI1_NITMO|nr:glycoside hydrolase family 15 protein [Nitrospira moscoviensis]ALA59015.1 Glycoside hydrolase [Nitrospira moscoviensis]
MELATRPSALSDSALLCGYPPIQDYALIGDCRTAALVSRHGSIDWLCLPKFDSPSCFNRLLDWERGGYCSLTPAGPFTTQRWYQGESPILVTEFHAERGRVRLTDLMPVVSEEDRAARLWPARHVLRRVECLDGVVDLDVTLKLRPDDGRVTPRFEARRHVGYCADLGSRVFLVATEMPLFLQNGALAGRLRLSKGERLVLWLAYAEEAPSVYPCPALADVAIDDTLRYWTGWARQCRYAGPQRERVVRSAMTLKLLSYAPSGAIVAAPTTSLPERVGGGLNWDYRYCWLRDASMSARVFFRLGFHAEAAAFMQWLTHATTLTYPRLQVMYDVHGETSLPESTVDRLDGYRRSRPVRTGNAASSQFQLDVYGELLDGVAAYVDAGHRLDRGTQRWIVRMADLVAEQWTQPDHGIWEVRGERRHYVHSKVWCWIALDRAEQLVRRMGIRASTGAWAQAREAISRVVLKTGYSTTRRSFVQVLGGSRLDAAALTFSPGGFIDGKDPRMTSTIAAVQRILAKGPLVYRYIMGKDAGPQEGAFLPCSFWMAEALATAGRRDDALALIDQAEETANDVGLYAEERRPDDGAAMGNYPLALTHVAHLSARLRLAGC